jgi:uracil-DNA glycosylase
MDELSLFEDFSNKISTPPPPLPHDWLEALGAEFEKSYWPKLQSFVSEQRQEGSVYPPEEDVFSAFQLTPYEYVRILLLGQDPYHGPGQAHGLCFSVRPGIETPPSLRNIYKELHDDTGCKAANNGFLVPWAEQGVLMLNAVLTVRAHEANSHKGSGWETFTDAVIKQVNAKTDPVVFVLWGGYAQKKLPLIDTSRHSVVQSVHPSPLSARNGFFGSHPFSQINAALRASGGAEIDWQIPDI